MRDQRALDRDAIAQVDKTSGAVCDVLKIGKRKFDTDLVCAATSAVRAVSAGVLSEAFCMRVTLAALYGAIECVQTRRREVQKTEPSVVRSEPKTVRRLKTLNHKYTALMAQSAAPAAVKGADRLLRIGDVTARTGLSRPYIYRKIAFGTFPAPAKVGKSSRWSALEIEAWIVESLRARAAKGTTP